MRHLRVLLPATYCTVWTMAREAQFESELWMSDKMNDEVKGTSQDKDDNESPTSFDGNFFKDFYYSQGDYSKEQKEEKREFEVAIELDKADSIEREDEEAKMNQKAAETKDKHDKEEEYQAKASLSNKKDSTIKGKKS